MYSNYLKRLHGGRLSLRIKNGLPQKNLRAPSLVAGARRIAAVSLAVRRLLFISSAIHLHPHFFFSESCSCSEDISFLL